MRRASVRRVRSGDVHRSALLEHVAPAEDSRSWAERKATVLDRPVGPTATAPPPVRPPVGATGCAPRSARGACARVAGGWRSGAARAGRVARIGGAETRVPRFRAGEARAGFPVPPEIQRSGPGPRTQEPVVGRRDRSAVRRPAERPSVGRGPARQDGPAMAPVARRSLAPGRAGFERPGGEPVLPPNSSPVESARTRRGAAREGSRPRAVRSAQVGRERLSRSGRRRDAAERVARLRWWWSARERSVRPVPAKARYAAAPPPCRCPARSGPVDRAAARDPSARGERRGRNSAARRGNRASSPRRDRRSHPHHPRSSAPGVRNPRTRASSAGSAARVGAFREPTPPGPGAGWDDGGRLLLGASRGATRRRGGLPQQALHLGRRAEQRRGTRSGDRRRVHRDHGRSIAVVRRWLIGSRGSGARGRARARVVRRVGAERRRRLREFRQRCPDALGVPRGRRGPLDVRGGPLHGRRRRAPPRRGPVRAGARRRVGRRGLRRRIRCGDLRHRFRRVGRGARVRRGFAGRGVPVQGDGAGGQALDRITQRGPVLGPARRRPGLAARRARSPDREVVEVRVRCGRHRGGARRRGGARSPLDERRRRVAGRLGGGHSARGKTGDRPGPGQRWREPPGPHRGTLHRCHAEFTGTRGVRGRIGRGERQVRGGARARRGRSHHGTVRNDRALHRSRGRAHQPVHGSGRCVGGEPMPETTVEHPVIPERRHRRAEPRRLDHAEPTAAQHAVLGGAAPPPAVPRRHGRRGGRPILRCVVPPLATSAEAAERVPAAHLLTCSRSPAC